MKKIDLNSKEFLAELEKTKKFTQKVCSNFGYEYNPDEEVNITIQQGLTRNKLIYGKRYCPCFMVIGKTKEEQKQADNRVCPCVPGTKEEIPKDGKCHCGIFCTPEHAKQLKEELDKKSCCDSEEEIIKKLSSCCPSVEFKEDKTCGC